MREKLQRHPYNIDTLKDGGNICLVDSVPSQANRLEPIFDEFEDPRLVRKGIVKVTSGKGKATESISLLQVGHRVADAIVRFSDRSQEIARALSEHEAGTRFPLPRTTQRRSSSERGTREMQARRSSESCSRPSAPPTSSH